VRFRFQDIRSRDCVFGDSSTLDRSEPEAGITLSDATPAVSPVEPHRRGGSVRTAALVTIAAVAVAFALYFGREVFIPIALAVVFMALLRPVVRVLERVRVPTALAALLVVLASLALLAGAGAAVVVPVQNFATQAPQAVKKAEAKLGTLVHGLQSVTGALGSGGGQGAKGSGQGGEGGSGGKTPGAAIPSSVAGKALGMTTGFLTSFLEVVLLVWFLLASGDMFLRKLVNVLPLMWEKKRAVEVVRETEAVVSRYLVVSLLINIGQGAAVALAMWLIGMPTPVLWGMMTVLLEFIPYLGGTFMVLFLGLIGLATFDSVGKALLAPGAYLLITTLQNNLVSPILYGRRLKLNPVAVLVAVMVWWFLWGVAGAFLAVPIIAATKVLADRVHGLNPLGEFLGE
jgi:predicted PurR-regulated permease PerM